MNMQQRVGATYSIGDLLIDGHRRPGASGDAMPVPSPGPASRSPP